LSRNSFQISSIHCRATVLASHIASPCRRASATSGLNPDRNDHDSATAILTLIDKIHAVRQLSQLAELSAPEACDGDLSRDAMSTLLVEVQARIDAVAEELRAMVQ